MLRTRDADGRVERLQFEGLGTRQGPIAVAYGVVPEGKEMDDIDRVLATWPRLNGDGSLSPPDGLPAADRLDQFVVALGKLDDTAVAALNDPTLSDVGRAAKLNPQQQAAREAYEQTRHALLEDRATLEQQRAQRFAAPALDPLDVVAALREHGDAEIYRQANRQERDRFHGLMNAGHPDAMPMLRALVRRGELLDRESRDVILKSIWEPFVEKRHRDEFAAIDVKREAVSLALQALDTMRIGVLDKLDANLPRAPRATEDVTYGAGPT